MDGPLEVAGPAVVTGPLTNRSARMQGSCERSLKNNASSKQKKREADRRHQRAAREKTRLRIAYLEATVEKLTTNDTSGQVASLLSRLEEVQKENDVLRKRMQDICTLAGLPVSKEHPENSSTYRPPSPREDPEVQNSASIEDDPLLSHIEIDPGMMDLKGSEDRSMVSDHCIIETTNVENLKITSEHPQREQPFPTESSTLIAPPILASSMSPETDSECSCLGGAATVTSLWRSADIVLSSQALLGDDPSFSDRDCVDDIPIRAVLDGWDSVKMCAHFDLSWQILETIDKLLFIACDQVERLAILITMHKLLVYHRDPSPHSLDKLPPWLRKRPAQDLTHTYATDYLAWPGLREKFIFSEHRYCGNAFWHLFQSCLKIMWAGTFEQCYRLDAETGFYKVTAEFSLCVQDLRNWAMTPEIFERFPELRNDIPAATYMQAPISNWMQWQFALGDLPIAEMSSISKAQDLTSSMIESACNCTSSELCRNCFAQLRG